jgi:hypothetical protein
MTPPDDDQDQDAGSVDQGPEPVQDQDQAEVTPQRSRGGNARKSRTLAARAAKRVKGRTVYLPDDLFERILVQSHRRGLTISDYVTGILERSVPDHRTDAA